MATWVAIGFTALGFIITVSVMWGKLTARMDNHEDRLDAHHDKHRDHYSHSGDLERHWTERERDSLLKQLDRIEELTKDLLKPRSGRPRHFPDNTGGSH